MPAAICAGSFSSIAGILLTPLLAAVLLGGSGGGFSADSLLKIVLQLLVPFLAGQLLRRWVGGFIGRHRKVLGYVDRGSILLVVYTAFSEGMVAGIWHQVTPLRLGALLGAEAVLLALMLAVSWYGSKRLGFGREDRIAIQFAGLEEEPGGGPADGQRPVRRARQPRGAAPDALPPDAADGLRGDSQAPLPRPAAGRRTAVAAGRPGGLTGYGR